MTDHRDRKDALPLWCVLALDKALEQDAEQEEMQALDKELEQLEQALEEMELAIEWLHAGQKMQTRARTAESGRGGKVRKKEQVQ